MNAALLQLLAHSPDYEAPLRSFQSGQQSALQNLVLQSQAQQAQAEGALANDQMQAQQGLRQALSGAVGPEGRPDYNAVSQALLAAGDIKGFENIEKLRFDQLPTPEKRQAAMKLAGSLATLVEANPDAYPTVRAMIEEDLPGVLPQSFDPSVPKILRRAAADPDSIRTTLTPEQAAAAGFRGGAVVQELPSGEMDVAQASDVYSPERFAQNLSTGAASAPRINNIMPGDRTRGPMTAGQFAQTFGVPLPGVPDDTPIFVDQNGKPTAIDMTRTLNTADAAKAQLLESGINNMESVKTALFPGYAQTGALEGVDRALLFTMANNIPMTEGRTIRVQLRDAIESKLRAESGAAVPDTEVARADERMMPNSLDSESTIQNKIRILDEFLRGSFDKFDPEGRYDLRGTLEAVPQVLPPRGGALSAEEQAELDRLMNKHGIR